MQNPVESVIGFEADRAEELNRLLLELPPEGARAVYSQVQETAYANGLWSEREGRRQPLSLALRPRLLDLSCRGYVHHVTWQIRTGLRKLAHMLESHPEARALLPLNPTEEEWIQRYRCDTKERVFCRLDALVRFDGPGWRSTLKFMEANVVGTAGLTYAPAAEAAFLEHLAAYLARKDEELVLEPNHDPRELLWEEFLEHARELELDEDALRVALVDDRDLYRLGGEMQRLALYYRETEREAVACDPRDLTLESDGTITVEGRPVHLVYRFLELGELAEMDQSQLTALHHAFRHSRVIPSVAGDLEHKSALEILTNPDFEEAFSEAQLEVYKEHVLWTRLLFDRRTCGPDGKAIELPDFVSRNRERLVLKPNRGYGGFGVLLGPRTSQEDWESALHKAMADPKSHVVQAMTEPNCEQFPVMTPEGLALAPRYLSTGFFPSRKGLGIFGRCSPGPVVNVCQEGGVVPFLVCIA